MLGRDSELAALGRAAAVGLVGEPGIGKSTVWNAFLDLQEGRRILRARPAESEAHLAYAALSDLFEDVDVTLSAPQQRAFDAARLREPGPVDERALGVAVRRALLQLQP